jgi:hypothetical protein
MAIRKPFKITVSNLSDRCKDDPETLEKLTNAKVEIDCLATRKTELFRKARAAADEAQIAMAQHDMAVQKFLTLAGTVDSQIAREESAMAPYTNSKGEICVDIPFTQREQRLAVRAAHKRLAQDAENDIANDDDMFDEGDEQ